MSQAKVMSRNALGRGDQLELSKSTALPELSAVAPTAGVNLKLKTYQQKPQIRELD
jgi:hypothetical protein